VVKERCVAIVQAEFQSIDTPSAIAAMAQKQLSNYNYSFPAAVSSSFPYDQS
jgi:hypothetical protein